ncbi:hypothetical protein V1525DRAFT_430431 [Lipomyces kononenkoae]|uniref:Uncharacterized protein n=1 Tax=Lipomyces kononenkoae TaxID=34357 RepID=A0ACC3T7B0_LIPKO
MTELDDSRKTLPETLITVLEPCEVSLLFDYHNRTHDVRPIATAFLQWGYDRDSLGRDLWKRITDSTQKIELLRKLIRPDDARMVFPSPESGFVPRRARTWPEVRSKFLQSDDLKTSIISWTRDFYLDLLFNYEGPFSCADTIREKHGHKKSRCIQAQVFDRDGVVSLIGKVRDESSPRPPPGTTYFSTAPLQGAHIIPFSANSHPELRTALSIFAGQFWRCC